MNSEQFLQFQPLMEIIARWFTPLGRSEQLLFNCVDEDLHITMQNTDEDPCRSQISTLALTLIVKGENDHLRLSTNGHGAERLRENEADIAHHLISRFTQHFGLKPTTSNKE